jgi:hypothetical protein
VPDIRIDCASPPALSDFDAGLDTSWWELEASRWGTLKTGPDAAFDHLHHEVAM